MGFDLDAAGFAGGPVAEAAPWPVFRSFDESAFDWVAVNVAELLGELGSGEDVEVVVASLPELGAAAFEEFGGFALEDADGCREWVEFRLAEEQMHMLRHKDVAEELELVALAESLERGEEGDAGVVVVEVGEPVITTEGEEVVMAFGLVTLQTTRHRSIVARDPWTPLMTMGLS